MAKLRILVTGGPTRAWLDRVRYLSNVSSGELAYRLCDELCRRGAKVTLVAGPTQQPFRRLPLRLIEVETADEMHAAVMRECRRERPAVAVFSAAVLDFAPARQIDDKVRSKGTWTLRLKPTKKIVDDVGRRFPTIKRVGFKLEWRRPRARDEARLIARQFGAKKLDALVLNYLSEIGGKRHPARFITADGAMKAARTKAAIATLIADWIEAAESGVKGAPKK